MFKIMDLLTGKTVIRHVDDDYVNTILSKKFEEEYEHGIPTYCWLSLEAMAAFDRTDNVQNAMAKYVINHGRFIDADANNKRGMNEIGCYFGFVRTKELARYHVHGTVRKGGVVLPSFLVKVLDQDLISDDFCGLGFTDEQGRVDIAFDREDFSTPFMGVELEDLPELYLEISELDVVTGIFQSVKRCKLPETQELDVEFDIDLTRGAYAQQQQEQQPVKCTELMREDLTGAEGKEGVFYIAELAPGAAAGKHTHPGDKFIYVLEGSLTVEPEGQSPISLEQGETAHQPPGQVHNARNPSESEPARVLVFLVAEKGKPLAEPVQ